MSYSKLLDEKCDIYTLKTREVAKGYGVTKKETYYEDIPTYTDVPCCFKRKSLSTSQGQPVNAIYEVFNVHFLIDTDIGSNYKIVKDGVTYITQIPIKPRNHHIEVIVKRDDEL